MRRRRQFAVGGALLLLLLIYFAFFSGGSGKTPPAPPATQHQTTAADHFPRHSPLNPDWKGSGHAVTLGFGGDTHFEGTVGANLTKDPSTALGTTIPQLFAGTQASMVNLETVITDSTCPEPQTKPYIFDAPASAVTALKSADISLGTEANDHGLDCGPQGLSQNLTIASQDSYPIIGIGNTAAQAFAPYRITIDGQRIAIISATQVIPDNLVNTWTATATQPGVASAIDPTELVREVQQVRRTADTVIVYVHWGTETQTCPNPQQEPRRNSSSRPVRTSSSAQTRTSCSAADTSAVRTSTTASATLPSTTPPLPRRTADRSSSPPRAAMSQGWSGAPPRSWPACPSR